MTYKITVFCEDDGHDLFLRPLVERVAKEFDAAIDIHIFSNTKGHGQVIRELKQFIIDLKRSAEFIPDILLVAVDTNCSSPTKKKSEVLAIVKEFQNQLVLALPNPHIERWLLIDSLAFKTVLSKGCRAPDEKCDKDRYKQLLRNAVKQTGYPVSIGGWEYAIDIVKAMRINPFQRRKDSSLYHLINDLRSRFKELLR